jgi:hypothetical protein
MSPSAKRFQVRCPTCGLLIECDASVIGTTISHDYCGGDVKIDDPAESLSPAKEALRRFDKAIPGGQDVGLARPSSSEPSTEGDEFSPAGDMDAVTQKSNLPARNLRAAQEQPAIDLASQGSNPASYDAEARREILNAADASSFGGGAAFERQTSSSTPKSWLQRRVFTKAVKAAEIDANVDVRPILAAAIREKKAKVLRPDWEEIELTETKRTRVRSRKVLAVTLVLAGGSILVLLGSLYKNSLRRREARLAVIESVLVDGQVPQSMKEAAEAFLKAPNAEQKLSYVRNPESDGPLVEAFFKEPGILEMYQEAPLVPFRKIQLGEFHYDTFIVGSRRKGRLLALVSTAGRWAIDWECFSRHCTRSFSDLLEGKVHESKPGDYRVLVKRGDYFNYDFSDDLYQCFQILSPDLDRTLYGYVPVGSRPEKALTARTQRKYPPRCILRLASPVGKKAAPEQVEIKKILSFGWVLPE